MKTKLKYILPAIGIAAAAVGIGIGASPRAVNTSNDIIFGENGPIKLVAPDGVVILSNANQTVTSKDYIHAGDNEMVKRYAFFVLDLNNGQTLNEYGETWLGIELKCSTNNFGMALANPTSDDKRPCYWSCTESNYQGSDDLMAYVIAPNASSSGQHYDNRGWIKINGSILETLNIDVADIDGDFRFPRKIGVLVGPEMLRTTYDNPGWLRSDNGEIVWSYMRTDFVGYETNTEGKAIWTMCEPSCWFSSIPKWASRGVNAE